MANIAILWDIENVTPPATSNYVQDIVDKISSEGKISYAMAFGDWKKQHPKLAVDLAANSFELIHVQHVRNIKDSSDMSMVAHGVELIFQYPHIDRYVLITGDADFRPLLQSLRKYGKETLIICNVINASEDLLKMADDFLDYRDIIDSDDDDDDDDELPIRPNKKTRVDVPSATASVSNRVVCEMTRQQAFELLEEALYNLIEEKKTAQLGVLKIKMKLLNTRFDETTIGYHSWKAFVKDAIKAGCVQFAPESDDVLIPGEKSHRALPEVFAKLVAILPPPGSDRWMTFNEAGKHITLRSYGYSQFKKLAVDAQKRGLVETKNEGNSWSLRAIKNKSLY